MDLWTDPVSYDPMRDGPPYLPGMAAPRVASTGGVPDTERRRLWAFIHKQAAQPGVEAEVILTHLMAELAGVPMAELAVVLAALRAEALIHQGNHWQTGGPQFYGDHQLFERLYTGAAALVDALAERTVGLGHPALVGVLTQHRAEGVFLESFVGPFKMDAQVNQPALSMRAVLRFLVLLDLVYGSLKKKGTLTAGLDNLLQGIADKHEEFAYLLRQRMGPGG